MEMGDDDGASASSHCGLTFEEDAHTNTLLEDPSVTFFPPFYYYNFLPNCLYQITNFHVLSRYSVWRYHLQTKIKTER